MANEATEALYAAMRAFEKLSDPSKAGELPKDAQKLLSILKKAKSADHEAEAWEILAKAKEEGVLDQLLQNLDKLNPKIREEVRRLFSQKSE
jgi:hypothetical protein